MFLSSNNGSTWAAVNAGLTNTYVLSLATSGTNVFAATVGSGVFMRNDLLTAVPLLEKPNPSVNLYPNPNTGSFTIDIAAQNQPIQITVFNVLGEIVYTEWLPAIGITNQKEIRLINATKGLYAIQITCGDKIYNSKMVIE